MWVCVCVCECVRVRVLVRVRLRACACVLCHVARRCHKAPCVRAHTSTHESGQRNKATCHPPTRPTTTTTPPDLSYQACRRNGHNGCNLRPAHRAPRQAAKQPSQRGSRRWARPAAHAPTCPPHPYPRATAHRAPCACARARARRTRGAGVRGWGGGGTSSGDSASYLGLPLSAYSTCTLWLTAMLTRKSSMTLASWHACRLPHTSQASVCVATFPHCLSSECLFRHVSILPMAPLGTCQLPKRRRSSTNLKPLSSPAGGAGSSGKLRRWRRAMARSTSQKPRPYSTPPMLPCACASCQ
jgi:hypothetical protein